MNKQHSTIAKEAWDWIKTIGIAVIIALFIRGYVFNISVVPTGSMIPTILEKDVIIVLKFSYRWKSVQRGDVVVFKPTEEINESRPENERKSPLVKRVVAIGGDTVEIVNGQVYVNDEPLEESYVYNRSTGNMRKVIVPEDSYFFLGDNRVSSWDARYWKNQFIPKSNILGKAKWKLGMLR